MNRSKIEINYDNCIDSVYSCCDSRFVYRENLRMQLRNILIKKALLMRRFLRILKRGSRGKSYRKNKNVKLSDLRYVQVLHYGFDGKVKEGELIVNKKIAKKTVKVFYALYQKRYRIERMRLIDDYGANDEKSMAANNTSAFNYRVISGTTKLSNHSYGMAIDINPRINPWVKGNKVSPANGKVYKQRKTSKCKGKYKRYMIHKNDTAYKIFKKYGFSWGGEWRSSKDYQHFEVNK